MSRALITESYLTGIANAIRTKLGVQNTYTPPQMASAIESIPTGITPTGTKNITQNGTHDVTQYASANVNVQPTLQSKTVTENGTVTPDQGYDGLSSVVVNVSGGSSSFITPDFQGVRVYCLINLNGNFRSLSTRGSSFSFFHVQANRRYAIYSDINNVYLRIHFYSGKTYENDFQQYVTTPGRNEDIYTATNNITGTTEISGEGVHKVFYYTPDTDGEIVVLTNLNTTNVAAYCVEMP